MRMVRAFIMVELALVATSGCFSGLGPAAIRGERPDYNQRIVNSADRESLLGVSETLTVTYPPLAGADSPRAC